MQHFNKVHSCRTFCSQEAIVHANIHPHFKSLLWPWPWTQQSNLLTGHFCHPILKTNRISSSAEIHEIYSRSSHMLITWTLTVTLTLKIASHCSADPLAHSDAPAYQVLLQKVKQFRRYHLNKIQTHRHRTNTINSICTLPPTPHLNIITDGWGGGGDGGGGGGKGGVGRGSEISLTIFLDHDHQTSLGVDVVAWQKALRKSKQESSFSLVSQHLHAMLTACKPINDPRTHRVSNAWSRRCHLLNWQCQQNLCAKMISCSLLPPPPPPPLFLCKTYKAVSS